jgi:hypothetical protein
MPRLPKLRRTPGRILIERRNRKPMSQLSLNSRKELKRTAHNQKHRTTFRAHGDLSSLRQAFSNSIEQMRLVNTLCFVTAYAEGVK